MAGEILSISPSKLETFRKYYTEAMNGFITEEKVIDSITGRTPWSDKMVDGTAFHKMIEFGPDRYRNGDKYYVPVSDEVAGHEDIVFEERHAKVARDYRSTIPGAVFEVNYAHKFDFQGYKIVMNMKMDAMWGMEVHDQKTTDKDPKVDSYEESLQWKIYLIATFAKKFQYNIFRFHRKNDILEDIELTSFYLVPRPSMNNEILETLDLFIRFCKAKNLMSYLIKKQTIETGRII